MQNFRKRYCGKKQQVSHLLADDFKEYFFEHGNFTQLKLRREEDLRDAILLLGGRAEFSCPLILLQTSVFSTTCSLKHL